MNIPHPRGTLTVYCGPMFSGKTTSLITHLHATEDPTGSLVIKPAFDTRYAESDIVTHDGTSLCQDKATTPYTVLPVYTTPTIPRAIRTIYIDEIQFMEFPHYNASLPNDVETWLRQGIDIVAAGLDMDYRGEPFMITASLLAMADTVHKITARCACCHGPATRTIRTVQADERMILGNQDIYEPRCIHHATP